MFLVDTSIWINFFNNPKLESSKALKLYINNFQPLCINSIIEMEILQGIRIESQYKLTKEYLVPFQYFNQFDKKYFDLATEIYRTCRKKGKTIRKSMDCLIAANALIDDLIIFHKDRDFEMIKKAFKELKTLNFTNGHKV